jgi:capsid protein
MRGGLNEMRRKSEQNQYRFVSSFCERILQRWLRFEALVGGIDRVDYVANRKYYEDVRWITPGWASVDPLKDVLATEKQLELGLTSRAAAIAETGEDHRRIDRENERDLETKRKLGYGPVAAADNPGFARQVALQPEETPKKRKEVVQ